MCESAFGAFCFLTLLKARTHSRGSVQCQIRCLVPRHLINRTRAWPISLLRRRFRRFRSLGPGRSRRHTVPSAAWVIIGDASPTSAKERKEEKRRETYTSHTQYESRAHTRYACFRSRRRSRCQYGVLVYFLKQISSWYMGEFEKDDNEKGGRKRTEW